jgi:hypothetical protein
MVDENFEEIVEQAELVVLEVSKPEVRWFITL